MRLHTSHTADMADFPGRAWRSLGFVMTDDCLLRAQPSIVYEIWESLCRAAVPLRRTTSRPHLRCGVALPLTGLAPNIDPELKGETRTRDTPS